jgi:precorrin-3B synthase
MTAAAMAKGWCPGALRPMESGDGLIVRLRIGGVVTTELAAEIARWSSRWGNGQIDLTSRANLQLRGVGAEAFPKLQDALSACGLLDASPAAEAVRNVIAGPLAGLDPDAVLDIRPLVAQLAQRLTGDPALQALPAKFGFAIDDYGRLGLGDAPADIRFEARRADDGPVFDIRLDGAPDFRLGPCRPEDLVDTAATLARAFIAARHASVAIRRMRDWVRTGGIDVIAAAAGLASSPCCAPRIAPASSYLGVHPLGAAAFVGIGLPFGRIAAQDLTALADEIARLGGQELRLTPWRTMLVPLPSADAGQALSAVLGEQETSLGPTATRLTHFDLPSRDSDFTAECAEKRGGRRAQRQRRLNSASSASSLRVLRGNIFSFAGFQPSTHRAIQGRNEECANTVAPLERGDAPFILDADDPLRRVAACVGAPACLRATTDVRADAVRLAKAMPFAGTLHVSGCAKGCAHPKLAALTLVGRDGRYDLIRAGAPWDAPAAHNLTVAQAERLIVPEAAPA